MIIIKWKFIISVNQDGGLGGMFVTNEVKVWLCNKETDMRKSIDG
jgi:hypothetical protein